MKGRTFQTSFWSDETVENLTPNAKFIFIYLMFNQYIGLTGAYQLSPRRMKFETGLPKDRIEKCLDELEERGRIARFEGGWILIVNAHKHNQFHKSSRTGVAYNKELETLPEHIQELLPISEISELEREG